jgi:acetolactate synthase-1/2/3 large subunit
MHASDLILAVGARFDDRVTNNPSKFCPQATIVHIDVDPATISKIIPADIPIVGPVASVLEEMDQQIEAVLAKSTQLPDRDALTRWWAQIEQWRKAHGSTTPCREGRTLTSWPRRRRASMQRRAMPRHQRRRPASDVAAQYYRFDAAPLDQLSTARWASVCRPRWACSSRFPTRRWSASGEGSLR